VLTARTQKISDYVRLVLGASVEGGGGVRAGVRIPSTDGVSWYLRGYSVVEYSTVCIVQLAHSLQ
jgi:hypothetical protein